jgi:hypothetical protein
MATHGDGGEIEVFNDDGEDPDHSLYHGQHKTAIGRLELAKRGEMESKRTAKGRRRDETLERMHRQMEKRKMMEHSVANWS